MPGMSYPNGKQTVPPFNRDQELTAYREMLLIRRFEEKAGQLYGMGLIGGFCPVSYTHLTLPTILRV